jgi:peptidoglycan/xylan/chitin deacetylase (PgdA/CDA1 family)
MATEASKGADTTPPWAWEESEWRRIVQTVRAGRSLRPQAWPGGARCAVALSFDSDHETNELRDGGTSVGRLSWGQYGARVGVPRIRALLRAHDVRASFYVPAVAALLYPDEQRDLIGEGHEIGIHGWIHELNSKLPAAVERDLLFRSFEALKRITGCDPVGIRTPSWDFSDTTLAVIEELGLLYDSSLMADEDCYELNYHGRNTGIVELPVEWIRDDAIYFMTQRFGNLRPHLAPSDVLAIFKQELDGAYREGGVFQLTCHPHIIGYRSRLWILDELIRHAKALPGVWFGTHAEVARWARDNAAPDPAQ